MDESSLEVHDTTELLPIPNASSPTSPSKSPTTPVSAKADNFPSTFFPLRCPAPCTPLSEVGENSIAPSTLAPPMSTPIPPSTAGQGAPTPQGAPIGQAPPPPAMQGPPAGQGAPLSNWPVRIMQPQQIHTQMVGDGLPIRGIPHLRAWCVQIWPKFMLRRWCKKMIIAKP